MAQPKKSSNSGSKTQKADLTARQAICSTEHNMLRDELHNLKSCQITFLTYSVTATGVLLGLGVNFNQSASATLPPLGAFYLIPLTILLPFWWIFFDKATTITRVVGYYRIIEKILLDPDFIINYMGWENALARFRELQQQNRLPDTKSARPLPQVRPEVKIYRMLILQTGHRYWMLTYYTFAGLSLLCLLISWASIPASSVPPAMNLAILLGLAAAGFILGIFRKWAVNIAFLICLGLVGGVSYYIQANTNDISILLIAISFFIFGASAGRNGQVVYQLTWGYYSYEMNNFRWTQILTPDVKTAAENVPAQPPDSVTRQG